jgi:phosphinothricin acetyltransferase
MIIRDADAGDAPAIAALYGHHVLHGSGTFEETPPSPEEIAARLDAVRARGLPYLAACDASGGLLGYAYASLFRPRAAYRYTAEDSVYVAPGQAGRGIGRALLSGVIARCEALGLRQLIGIVGDSGNAASIGLHAALGFDTVGVAAGVGFKHGRWVDIVMMRRALNGGDASAPEGPGLSLGGP